MRGTNRMQRKLIISTANHLQVLLASVTSRPSSALSSGLSPMATITLRTSCMLRSDSRALLEVAEFGAAAAYNARLTRVYIRYTT